jgi:hypothetical protein
MQIACLMGKMRQTDMKGANKVLRLRKNSGLKSMLRVMFHGGAGREKTT